MGSYGKRLRASLRYGLVVVSALSIAVVQAPVPASAAGASASIDQCTNGPVGPPINPQPCVGSNAAAVSVAIAGINGGASTSYKNWVNGNSNGSKSHWREGEFIAYRATVSGIAAGSHTLIFTYDTVHSGGHAEDYIGSFDATETTATAPTSFNGEIIHANNSSPCADLVLAGQIAAGNCNPASPAASTPAPAENFGPGAGGEQACGGAGGVYSGPTGSQGTIKFFGQPASFFGPVSATIVSGSDNAPSGTGQCTTSVSLNFTTNSALSSSQSIVVAWGGHIASAKDWGIGNSASAINGSPYHESLVSLDGASTGSQDRALSTNAIFFTPTISTTLHNAANNAVIANGTALPFGTSVYDTAALANASPTAGGTVTYNFFTNGTCAGTPSTTQTVTVTNDSIPQSATKTGLAPGSYSFDASYSGDSIDVAPPVSGCEPFSIGKASVGLTTTPSSTSITLSTSSVTLKDTATLTGGTSPTGTITFTLTAPNGTTVLDTETVTVNGDGSYTTPAGFTLPTTGTVVGTYQWHASYSGDANNNPITQESNPTAERVVVSPASPALTTTPGPTVMLGSGVKLTDTAHLTGGYNPTGTITFTLFDPTSKIVDTETVTVTGNGDYSTPTGFLPLIAGTYQWNASYSGDGNNNAVSDNGAANEQEVVSPNQPALSTTPNVTSVTLGTSSVTLKDTANLTGGTSPTGTITFKLTGPGSVLLDTETVTVNGDGTYTTPVGFTLPTTGSVVGTYQWDASYSGDANNNPVTQESNPTAEKVTVSPASPAIVTTPSTTSVTLGTSTVTLKDSAALSGGYNPTGTIVFTLVGPSHTTLDTETVTVSGNGTYTTPVGFTLPTSGAVTGTYQWNATYSGDANNNTASDTGNVSEQVVVSPATPTLSTTPGGTVVLGSGARLTDTAHLAGGYNPTGTITFTLTDPANKLVDTETVTVTGNGDYSTPAGYLPVIAGTYQWHASYSGDANNNPIAQESNAANEQEVVSPNTPTLSTTPNPSSVTLGNSTVILKDSATLAGGTNPTGSITFTLIAPDGTTVLDTEIVTVNGDGTYSTPTGFTLSTSSAVVGFYQWNATYGGDTNNNQVTDNGNPNELVAVSPASPTLVTTPAPSSVTLGTSTVTLKDSAVLSGGYFPTGTITFTLKAPGGATVDTETVSVSGNGTYTTPVGFTLPASGIVTGTYQWNATYGGDGNNKTASDNGDVSEQVVVSPASPKIVTTPDPTSVTLGTTSPTLKDSAVLSGGYNPTGTITFTLVYGSTTVDTETVPVSGNGTYSTPVGFTLPASGTVTGTYQWNATYSGDGNNTSASDNGDVSEQVTVSPAQPAIVTTPDPTTVTLGTTSPTLKDAATLSGGYFPTGTITFTLFHGATLVDTETVPVSGNGVYATPTGFTLPTSGTATGTYQWDATYSGDSNNASASDNGDVNEQVTVSPASPAMTTTPGPTVTLGDGTKLTDTAHLSGGFFPTGTITFTLVDPHGTVVDTETVTVSGNGDYTTPGGYLPLIAGTYQWNASYSGDANNNAIAQESNPTNEQEVVNPSRPTIVTTPDPSSVTLGTSSVTLKDTAALSGATNPTGTITFTLQDPSSAVVDTEVVTVSGNGTYTTPTGFTLPITGTVTGTYQWNAAYSGDSNNTPASEIGNQAEQVKVSPASPSLTTTPDPTSVTLGTSFVTLKDTADLEGGYHPTGTITFTLLLGSTTVDTETVGVSGNGTYTTPTGFTLPITGTVTGTYQWNAVYSGDGNNISVADNGNPNEQVTVSPAAPAITTTPNPTSVTLGTSTVVLKDSAVLSGGYAPTGTITFTLVFGSTTVDTETVSVSGNGTYSTPTGYTVPTSGTVTGTYQWNATYSGDGNNNPATDIGNANELVQVSPAQPAISTTPNPTSVTLGTSTVTLKDTATLSGGYAPTGTITFTLVFGSTTVDTETVTVSGNGSYTTPTGFTLPTGVAVTGTWQWNAVYSGDGNNNAVADNGNPDERVTVSPASPNIVTTPDPTSVTLGTSSVVLKDSAVLSGGYFPTGTITFTLVFGTSTVDTETVSVSGNGTYTTPAGYTLPTSGTVTGTYQWNAAYSGDGNNNAASDNNALNEQVTISPASPAIATTPSVTSVTLGTSSVTLKDTAVLSGGYAPTGTITFTLVLGSTTVDTETATVSGNGSYTTPTGYTLPATGVVTGTYQWNATYSGDGNNNSVSETNDKTEQVIVSPASPAIATTPTPTSATLGTSTVVLKDSAVLSGGYFPTGSITFTLVFGSTTVDTETVSVSGNGTYTTPTGYTLPSSGTVAGTYQWNATYSGDGNNNSVSETNDKTEQVTISPASPAIATTPSITGITLGTTSVTVKDTAVLSGGYAPTGSITFTLVFGGSTVDTETVAVSGNGSYTTPTGFALPTSGVVAGTYQWNATYSGDGNNNGASETNDKTEQVVVGKAGPTLTTNQSPSSTTVGATLKDTATLAGGYFPTGTITFTLYDPSNNVVDSEIVTVSGNGSYTTPTGAIAATAGTYQWVATYSGDANNNSATSTKGSEPVTVIQPNVSQITPTQTTCSQFAGGTAGTLGNVFYSTKGKTISSDNPGVMFYWVKVTVTTSGSHTFFVTQTTNYPPGTLFTVSAGSFAYDANCNTLSTTLGPNPGNLSVSFNGGPGTYFIGIKYSPKSVVGTGPASTTPGFSYTYTFATTGVSGSTSTIKLTHS